ncbi:endonuclease domain-containing protein [Erythrobacter sp. SDW2]|uniref:endonuclease domain-containing protein n=1 Tax=Erythrobacter sp. SDW2 TaxID=2907154 RepID=UPI001F2E6CE6|nr:DUF559 domain-containing protein [Erythrobacter sp. SDW2]UIP07544.1 endonuclease domain-containing protein [Erythrobacter sp. SDW2]
MSLPEVLLWQQLKGCTPKFRRQFGIDRYVADFACTSARLIVEIEGIAHDMGDRPERDEIRTAKLKSLGWTIERIAARAVLDDPQAIAEALLKHAESMEQKSA